MLSDCIDVAKHTHTPKQPEQKKKVPVFSAMTAALQKLDFIMPVYMLSNKKWSQTNKNNKIKLIIM